MPARSASTRAPFSSAIFLFGMEEGMIMTITDPDLLDRAVAFCLDFSIAVARLQVAAATAPAPVPQRRCSPAAKGVSGPGGMAPAPRASTRARVRGW